MEDITDMELVKRELALAWAVEIENKLTPDKVRGLKWLENILIKYIKKVVEARNEHYIPIEMPAKIRRKRIPGNHNIALGFAKEMVERLEPDDTWGLHDLQTALEAILEKVLGAQIPGLP